MEYVERGVVEYRTPAAYQRQEVEYRYLTEEKDIDDQTYDGQKQPTGKVMAATEGNVDSSGAIRPP